MLGFLVEEVGDKCVVANWGTANNDAFGTVLNAEFRCCDRGDVYCCKETRWQASRHKQELEQETIKGTRTGEKRQSPNED